MTRATPEGAVKNAVIDLLNAERIWWQRNQSAVQIIPAQNGQRRRFIKSGRVGVADILAFIPAVSYCSACGAAQRPERWKGGACIACGLHSVRRRFMPAWIEVKKPKGWVQSVAQKAFQAEVTAQGHAYLLVNDPSILQAWLKANR